MKLQYGIGYNWNKVRRVAVAGLKKLDFDRLLSGAWFHKKEPTYEVVDETPGVDTSRTWRKARALQFTDGTDYVSISKTYPSTDTPVSFEVTLEIITGNSIVGTQDIFCTDDAGQASGIQLRIENYLSDWRFGLRVGNVVGRDASFAVQTNTRYIVVISYDGTDATLTVNGATNLTITPTSAIAGAGLIMLGRRYTSLGNYFNGILGYVKIKEDNIVIGEYAFEEGVGTYCFNRISNNFHGTINNATISTFRVEDVRITNGDQGTFLNTEGYSLGRLISNDLSEFNPTQSLLEHNQTYEGFDDVSVLTNLAGTIDRMFIRYSVFGYSFSLDIGGVLYDSTIDVYMPSSNEGVNAINQLDSVNFGYQYPTQDDWDTLSYSGWESNAGNNFRIFACVGNSINVDDVLHVGDQVGFRNFELRSTNVFYPRLAGADTNIYGNPLTYKGQVAQPLSLVNSNGIRFGDQEQIELTNDLTVSDFTEIAYVYFDSTLESGTFMRALFFYDTGSATNGWVTIENNELRYANSVSGGQSEYLYTTVIPNFLDTWQKVGISRTGSEIVIVVGDEVRTVDISAVAAGTNTFEAIGRGGNNPKGDLAWISFHSKGMTAEEIKAIDPYNMDTDSLEVFYAPSVGSGSTIYDLSGNNNHGTIDNATLSDFWIKQDQFHWNLKKGFDQVYNLDGVDDYIEPDSMLSVTGDFFIEFGFLCEESGFYISSDGGDYLAVFSNYIKFRTANGPTDVTFTGIETGQFYNVRIERNGDQLSATINGVYYPGGAINTGGWDIVTIGTNSGLNSFKKGFISYLNLNDQYFGSGLNWPNATVHGNPDVLKIPISTQKDGSLSNPAGKWHNDAETEINFPHTAKLHMINEQFDYKPFFDITLSGNAGVESWVKNVSFADMYQTWYDYEYLHRLFANFEIPNQVHKILAYSDELTADQRQQVYDYLQKNY